MKESLKRSKREDVCLLKTETANVQFKYMVDIDSIILDLKAMIKEYYFATFSEEGNSLILKFSNGQKFRLSIDEIK